MEGIMMKNGRQYAVAVRSPGGQVVVAEKEYKGILDGSIIKKLPFFRGVFNFVDSLVLGMQTLMYSASFFEGDDTAITGQAQSQPGESQVVHGELASCSKKESLAVGVTVAVSMAVAVVVFMLVPYFITRLFGKAIGSQAVLALLEGVLRLCIFLAYILLISRMEDIQRVFMYHGAEHKCINCIEHGMELNVENVRKSSRLHKRCGTSFLFLVVFISIIFFFFIRTDSALLRIAARLLLVPVIAGCAYEWIRLAGRHENRLTDLLSRPGLALQKLTTREPDDGMIEVGIASVEAVFDWKAFLKETVENGQKVEERMEGLHDISGSDGLGEPGTGTGRCS